MKEYKGRGIHKPELLGSLLGGKLSELLRVAGNCKDLDVQLREDYANVYYNGGCIIKINGENSAGFDEKYFNLKKNPVSAADEMDEQRRSLLKKFKSGDYIGYFSEAMRVMAEWFNENPNPERNEQHRLATENKSGDYVVVDIEYQVSTQSKFKCTGPKKSPRFDIVAVNRRGQLYVIELKKGSRALKGSSGLKEHLECYYTSIGRNPGPFVEEMKLVLSQKQQFGLIDKSIAITGPEPAFMFAYAYDSKTSQYADFMTVYEKIRPPVPCLFLKDGSLKLSDL